MSLGLSLGGNKNKFTNVGSHLPIYYTGKSETAGQLLKYQNKIKKEAAMANECRHY